MKPDTPLFQLVAKGGMWVFALRVFENSLRLLRLVIVARILAPHDFGLFGIALLVMAALETFSQMGFQAALVQKKGDITPYLDTIWTVSMIRGVVLFIILFISAPYIALFFNTPQASLIIQVVGATLCVGGFINSGIVYFQKELEFNKQFLFRLATTMVDFIVVVTAALVWKNVWALVFGLLAGSLAGLVASYAIHPYRPRFRLNVSKTRELLRYGRWVFGSTILVFLITQGDDAFVGKFLGATMLGFYQMAYRISNMPATEITHVISQVTFPAYAKIQDDLPRLREAYLRVLQLTAFLSFPIAGLIFVLAPDFTSLFLGEKWMPMVSAMQVLALAGLIRSLTAIPGPVYLASGVPQQPFKKNLFRLLLTLGTIYPFMKGYGITGAAISVLLGVCAALVYDIIYFKIIKDLRITWGRVLRDLTPIWGTTFLFSILLVVIRVHITKCILNFFIMLFIALLIYLVINYCYSKIYKHTAMEELKSIFKTVNL